MRIVFYLFANREAHILNTSFEDAEGGRIGDLFTLSQLDQILKTRSAHHESSEIVLMFLRFGTKVLEVKVTIGVDFDSNNFKTSHSGRLDENYENPSSKLRETTYSRVSSMSTERDKANIAVTLAPRFMVGTNNTEASVFSSSPRVRLERGRVETSDLAKVVLEFLNSFC